MKRPPDRNVGVESVWDYPRPPVLEPVADRLRVEFAGHIVADSARAYRILETSHPPTYYFTPSSIEQSLLRPSQRTSFCEWKGQARYVDLLVGEKVSLDAGWHYPAIREPFSAIEGWFAFYANRVEACWVGEDRVQPQEGDFYGGWVTSRIAGPFKGGPGTHGW